MKKELLILKERAEADLEFFINLIHPQRVLGSVHKDLIQWWTKPGSSNHQLVLLPRDHMKSALAAYRVAWEITRNPCVRILYLSSTSSLAEKQLHFIKQIIDSDQYRRFWPEMINPDEGKREKWSLSEISVDHPLRKTEVIRDPTILTGGLTTGITGFHCDIAVLDDCVVSENAYTEDGRDKVKRQFSLIASIEGAEAQEWVVGTRYHPKDLYHYMQDMKVEDFDDYGEVLSEIPVYDIFERKVENRGDGSGEFLWPRQQRSDGKWFGFDQRILATKRAKYLDKMQYRAQYYNEPNDASEPAIDSSNFQYYDQAYLTFRNSAWFMKEKKLNIFASVDFAYSLSKKADYTAIVVVGIDSENNYYICEIRRFKTDKIEDYFANILELYSKWGFRKLKAEVSMAQSVIVQALKEQIRQNGLLLSIEEFRPNRYMGAKEERIQAALEPRYDNHQIFHYKGGNCQILEEELILNNPPHDDVKDALASCISFCVPPQRSSNRGQLKSFWREHANSRFGGIC